jgi:hypothetical protein
VADADPERAERLNVGVVKNLAGLCGKNGIGMIYISTDYVFDGTAWVESFFLFFALLLFCRCGKLKFKLLISTASQRSVPPIRQTQPTQLLRKDQACR